MEHKISPYYRASHEALRKKARKFCEQELLPYISEWEEAQEMPLSVRKKCFEAGLLPFIVGPPWPEKYGCGPCPVVDHDYFHELIVQDEVHRAASAGVGVFGLFGGAFIGMPPVLHHGSELVKQKCVGPVLRGEKVMSIAITEPYAGSDVAGLRTTATLSEDGTHFLVSGEKKWITSGKLADFYTTAVRTGGDGGGGVSILLIERGPGVNPQQMDCMGVHSSSTSFVVFDDVKVPKENIVGEVNKGFPALMTNFNHERWTVGVAYTRLARVCYEESFAFSHRRKTFGQRLIDHPVLRNKMGEMARQIEAVHHWVEAATYLMCQMPKKEADDKLGGQMALLKVQATKTAEFCAREAAQIFGGVSYVRGGQAEKIERIYREVRAGAIAGGSEEIMLDLGMRQAMRHYAARL